MGTGFYRSRCSRFLMVKGVAAGLLCFLMLLLASCRLPVTPAGNGHGEAVEGQQEKSLPEEEPGIMYYPTAPGPGDFTMLAVGPCPAGSSVTVEAEPGFTLSPPYRHGDFDYFILGIGFQVQPGAHILSFRLDKSGGGECREIAWEMEVAPRDFETSRFSVPVKWSEEEAAQRISEESERVRLARRTTEPAPLWYQPFIIPLDARISSEYGAVRIINEGAPSRHAGLDLAAHTGTPVAATNDGIVRLAAPLLAHGNMVIIDHGMNLSSSYLHLDSIEVEEGVRVSRGQIIGLVGETGFASGPHLHWEVNLGQIPVNPLQLVQDALFYLPTPAVP